MERNSSAGDALAEVARAHTRLADRLYTPWWYHPILGILLGALVLQIGGVFGRPGVFLMAAPVLGIIVLGRIYRHLSGIDLYGSGSPDGGRRGRSLLAVYICALIVCFAITFTLSAQLGLEWTAWVLTALVVAGTIAVGRTYDELLRDQLRSTAP